jgi:hypothetical protein
MLYLVIGESLENAPRAPNEMIGMLEQIVIPSFETLIKMENDKKVLAGGLYAGARTGMVVLDADSHEECNKLLQSLPFWGELKWTITPLISFTEGIKMTHDGIELLKQIQP